MTGAAATGAAREAATGGGAVTWRADRAVAVSPDDEEVWLFGGPGPVRLGGRRAGPLARAVDGVRDLPAVVAQAVASGMPAEDAERIASRWRAAGHLVPAAADEVGTTGRPLVRLVDDVVAETAAGAGDAAPPLDALAAALRLAGADVVRGDAAGPPGREPLTVRLVDDLLAAEEATAGQAGPVVLVQLRGDRPMVSPVLHSDAACPTCLVSRLALRRTTDLVAAARVGRHRPPPHPVEHRDAAPTVAALVVALAAARLRSARGEAEGAAAYGDHVLVVDPGTALVERHRLVRVAGCPTCDPGGPTVAGTHLTRRVLPGGRGAGGANERTGDGVVSDSGGFRVVDPEETWQRYAHLVSDVVGVVPYVVPTGPPELRAFTAGPNVAAEEDLALLRSRLRHASGGKGVTLTAARTGALAEAVERHSLRADGREPTVRARLADLENALHPNDIQLFSDAQLHRAATLTALGIPTEERGMHRVPLPFDADAEHDWSAVADLRTGAVRWLPSTLVWFGWPRAAAGAPHGSSNGAAAGNTVEEALLQGVLELVERDSVALWWHPRCRRPAFDLDSWEDPRIESALWPQRALGTEVWVLDVTTDLGIPAAAAVATGVGPAPRAPLVGFGAHLDPALAVVRALTELAQMQAPIAALRPGDDLDLGGEAERRWFAEVTPDTEPWLAPIGVVAPPASPQYAGVVDALDDAVGRIAARGYDVLWADCTRPDFGLPVVRTWAPGLRHFWNRYAPGRLYDVPPALGWCAGGYGESDLNPRAMIL